MYFHLAVVIVFIVVMCDAAAKRAWCGMGIRLLGSCSQPDKQSYPNYLDTLLLVHPSILHPSSPLLRALYINNPKQHNLPNDSLMPYSSR